MCLQLSSINLIRKWFFLSAHLSHEACMAIERGCLVGFSTSDVIGQLHYL